MRDRQHLWQGVGDLGVNTGAVHGVSLHLVLVGVFPFEGTFRVSNNSSHVLEINLFKMKYRD